MTSWLKWTVCLALIACVSRFSLAQEAPTGDHYAGRASDTGAGGGAFSASGDYTGAVPLPIPPERSGLPIPIQIVYSSHGVGAAGQGWEIPLFYIQRERTYAHSRPVYAPCIQIDPLACPPPQPRERLFLSVMGAAGELVATNPTNPSASDWILRKGTLQWVVRQSGTIFYAYDGEGRTYQFVRPAQLGEQGLWLLQSIRGAGGRSVTLSYQLTAAAINGGQSLEIDLIRVAYNTTAVSSCAKNEIALWYGQAAAAPLSLSVLGDKALARFRVLKQVSIQARATCAAPLETLRRVSLGYAADLDTQLPRLTDVTMFGRQGSSEAAQSLPLGRFSYAAATQETVGGRVLNYVNTQTLPLPGGIDNNELDFPGLSRTDSAVPAPVPGEVGATWQALLDIDGDGRPDFLYRKGGKLLVQANQPAAHGATTFAAQSFSLQDTTFSSGPLSTYTSTSKRFWYGTADRNTVDSWRKAIDFNGDGRIDFIDAGEEAGHWVIYLNTPGPNGIKWQRVSISVENLIRELSARHHDLSSGYLPLSRRSTGVTANGTFCLSKDSSTQKWAPTFNGDVVVNGNAIAHCDHGVPNTAIPPICIDSNTCAPMDGVESTFVEWDLFDVNGDGYPDFVFNSDVSEFFVSPNGSGFLSDDGKSWFGQTVDSFRLPDVTDVRLALNAAGVSLDPADHYAFSRSVALHVPDPVAHGVAHWQGDGGADERQTQVAGFVDVNGDGLMDRVIGVRAYLGSYQGTAQPISTFYITLPAGGGVSEQVSNRKTSCRKNDFFNSTEIRGIRDLTGDGFPDYFANDAIYVGTGAGFVPASIPVKVPSPGQLQFSHARESCRGDWSDTDGGLFDVDADGKPDFVTVVNGGQSIQIAQIDNGGATHSAEAGRISDIDNGFGAVTHLVYKSAKEDIYSRHAIPFPEIVVTGVSTIGNRGLGGTVAGSAYAFGNAQLVFDSQSDRFSFPGYGRRVSVALYKGKGDETEGMARVADAWPLVPFNLVLTQEERWQRELQVGMPMDEYFLGRSTESDPWPLLTIDASDSRITGNHHMEWTARLLQLPLTAPNALNIHECVEMVDPYDFAKSVAYTFGANGLNPCIAHGFAYPGVSQAWSGASPPPSSSNIQTRKRVLAVDDYGRELTVRHDNDVFRDDDDLCEQTEYAAPVAGCPRVLSAVSARSVTQCDKAITLSSEAYLYDNRAAGNVSIGKISSYSVDRRASDGTVLATIHRFDATHDSSGNVKSITTQRAGMSRTVTLEYDSFGLAPVRSTIVATGVAATVVAASLDPLTLDTIETRDRYQVRRGTRFDGFGRAVQRTLVLPNASPGIVATHEYLGFDGTAMEGRRVVSTAYQDPVPANLLAATTGQVSTVYFDELGRQRRTEVGMGADYANDSLVLGDRSYDEAGRVAFAAEPYPKSESPSAHFGTSYFFNSAGKVDCAIKGNGPQAYTRQTDVSQDRFVTCTTEQYDNHLLTLAILDPGSLQSDDPHDWIIHQAVATAVGQTLERSTSKWGVRLEYATFEYDGLGRMSGMTRFGDPQAGNAPVHWSWSTDSLGQVREQQVPESANRFFEYNEWGEMTDVHWQDGASQKRLSSQFDALGRVVESEELNNGTPDSSSARKFSYDHPLNVSPLVAPTFTGGRFAGAKWSSGEMSVSYDSLGNVNAEAYQDNEGGTYVDRFTYHAGGSLRALRFELPDHGYTPEDTLYEYDSAGQLRSVVAHDGTQTTSLYEAQSLDRLGRTLMATFGSSAVFTAEYAQSGRRLPQWLQVVSASASKRIELGDFDVFGREKSRREVNDGTPDGPRALYWYNDSQQLASVQAPGSTWKLIYDSLGNLTAASSLMPEKNVSLRYSQLDRDRICRIDYGPNLPVQQCNVTYDGTGAMTGEPTRTGTRQLDYFASGGVRHIVQGAATADFKYDALGRMQALDVHSQNPNEQRRDRQYGALMGRRDVLSGNGVTAQVMRRVPGPGGVIATRYGFGDSWIYGFAESRGMRVTTDKDGNFVQQLSYQPYGEATTTGAQQGTDVYTSSQWNGGDSLDAFGLVNLGARVYDPVIGRFLSRDPRVSTGGALASNPYSFAMGDPINASDPSGLDCYPNYGPECKGNQEIADPYIGPGVSQPAASASPIAEPQALEITMPAWGFLSDEATGAIRLLQGLAPQPTLPWKQRGFDPSYWLLRAGNAYSIPSDDNPFALNQALLEAEQMQVTPECGAPPTCLLAAYSWLADGANDDPGSGIPPFHTVLQMFDVYAMLSPLAELGAADGLAKELGDAGRGAGPGGPNGGGGGGGGRGAGGPWGDPDYHYGVIENRVLETMEPGGRLDNNLRRGGYTGTGYNPEAYRRATILRGARQLVRSGELDYATPHWDALLDWHEETGVGDLFNYPGPVGYPGGNFQNSKMLRRAWPKAYPVPPPYPSFLP